LGIPNNKNNKNGCRFKTIRIVVFLIKKTIITVLGLKASLNINNNGSIRGLYPQLVIMNINNTGVEEKERKEKLEFCQN
tara:strand:+ start:144 stop:380 length:237 start_codon:yes stop_codon:yes gene_type:complete